MTVFQGGGETAGFILRATARCPLRPFPQTTHELSVTDSTVTEPVLLGPTHFLLTQPQLRRCVKFNWAFRLMWIRGGLKSSAGVVRPTQSLFG